MAGPRASRPHMPGYGLLGSDEGTGLLPWSWAQQRLSHSHDYWVATVRPDGRPHLMPVWGIWHRTSLWLSSSNDSRKARSLAANPQCSVATDDPAEPVIVEGIAERIDDPEAIANYAHLVDNKYATHYGAVFYDPQINRVFRIRPSRAFGLTVQDFTGSPTLWTFDSPPPP